MWGEYDSPGCCVREIAVQGTHKGEWCGVAGTGRRVKFHACALYLFSKDDTSGKLLAERLYFDNETVMKQINGQAEAASVPEVGDHQIALAKCVHSLPRPSLAGSAIAGAVGTRCRACPCVAACSGLASLAPLSLLRRPAWRSAGEGAAGQWVKQPLTPARELR